MDGSFSIDRAPRINAIKAYVLAEIANPDLCLADIAAQQGISSSYVRKLFAAEGTRFTAFVLETRLQNVCRMLMDREAGSHSIGAVAMTCGFNDVSYFNRAFRNRFGCTPSDMRCGRAPSSAATQAVDQLRPDPGPVAGFASPGKTVADQR